MGTWMPHFSRAFCARSGIFLDGRNDTDQVMPDVTPICETSAISAVKSFTAEDAEKGR